METIADGPLLERAGRLADAHAMYWLRRLEGPIEDVWQAVSTLDGLKKWWILPGTATAFDLHRGGRFSHHWENTITDFKEFEFIDFAENTGAYQGTGGARFELTPIDETATMFMFLDTWGADMTAAGHGKHAEQPGGPGTPWSGVAAGWHRMMDEIERIFSGVSLSHSYEDLCSFYVSYIHDLYRWHGMVQRTTNPFAPEEE